MKVPTPDLLRNRKTTGWWLVLLLAAWVSLSWQIEDHPLDNWDEARLAVNAVEMLHSREWIVTTFGGAPDLWNTKPPLLVWLQAGSMAAFGYSEWAFRLPTTVAALALVGLVVAFARRWLGGELAALLAGFALLGSKGFVTLHVARSGDYESFLLLFMTGQVLSIFAWLQTRQRRYLLLAGLCVGLAVLTKSVVGLLFLPGLAIEVVRRGRFFSAVRQPIAWLSLALALGLPLLWYTIREQAAPGYLLAVWQNELGGRFAGTLEEHAEPWYFYLIGFGSRTFLLWTPWLLGACWLLARRPVSRPARQFLLLAAWTGGIFLLLISVAATKLYWYVAPLYPLLALTIGGGLSSLTRRAAAKPSFLPPYFAAVLVLALAFVPSGIAMYRHLVKMHRERYDIAAHTYGQYLQNPAATPTARFVLFSPGYNASLEFYAQVARRTYPTDTIQITYDQNQLRAGQTVLVCGAAAEASITKEYHVQLLHKADSCATLLIQNAR